MASLLHPVRAVATIALIVLAARAGSVHATDAPESRVSLSAISPADSFPFDIDWLKAEFPGATQLYAKQIDRPILQCSADADGCLLVVMGGKGPTTLAVMDTTGAVAWHHNLRASFSGPSPDCFVQGANGTILAITGVDEERANYLVLDHRGIVIFDQVIDGGTGYWMLGLSPSGAYYYRVFQHGSQIHLVDVVSGAPKIIDLEALPGFTAQSSIVDILEGDQLVVTQGLAGPPHGGRTAVLDIDANPPAALQVWDTSRQPLWRRSHADDGSYCDLIGGVLVSCHENRGGITWSRQLYGIRAIVRASDRPLVAILRSTGLEVLDSSTGRQCGSLSLPSLNLLYMAEGRFSEGRLIANVNAGDATRLVTLTMGVTESCAIVGPTVHAFITCGLESSRPVLGVAKAFSDSGVVAAFRKSH
jgi:hypothetical protein